MARQRIQHMVAASASLMMLTACGPVVTTSSTVETPTTTAPSTTIPAPTTVTTSLPPTTSAPTTTTTIATTLAIGDWEGDLVDFGPRNGDALMVVGVRYNDVLNVREGPGTEFPVVTVLDPDAADIDALGLTWLRPDSAWFAVSIDGEQGWASGAFLLHRGGIVDVTDQVVDRLGEVPESGSLITLGLTVAEAMASDEPPSSVEQPAAVVVGSVGEMIVDVVGLGDDSVGGFRLRVVANDVDGTWVLDRVEATLLCLRGVDRGSCV